MSQSNFNFFQLLPSEVILEVLKKLDLANFSNIQHVDKQFLNFGHADFFWKKQFKLQFPHYFSQYARTSILSWYEAFREAEAKDYPHITNKYQRLFLQAAKTGDLDTIKKLIEKKRITFADIDSKSLRDKNNLSPLEWAIKNKQQGVLDYFYQLAIAYYSKNRSFPSSYPYRSLLYWAIVCNQSKEIIEELAKKHTLQECYTEDKLQTIHLAAKYGQLDVIKRIEAKHPGSVSAIYEEMVPLYFAIKGNHTEVVKHLVVDKNVNTTLTIARDNHFRTPLWLAVEEANLDIVELLFDEAKIGTDQIEAIHIAAIKNDIKKVQELLNSNRDLLHKVGGAKTPLLWAIKKGHVELAKYLLAQGAQPFVYNIPSYNPHLESNGLYLAIENNDVAMLEVLLEHLSTDQSNSNRLGMPFKKIIQADQLELFKKFVALCPQTFNDAMWENILTYKAVGIFKYALTLKNTAFSNTTLFNQAISKHADHCAAIMLQHDPSLLTLSGTFVAMAQAGEVEMIKILINARMQLSSDWEKKLDEKVRYKNYNQLEAINLIRHYHCAKFLELLIENKLPNQNIFPLNYLLIMDFNKVFQMMDNKGYPADLLNQLKYFLQKLQHPGMPTKKNLFISPDYFNLLNNLFSYANCDSIWESRIQNQALQQMQMSCDNLPDQQILDKIKWAQNQIVFSSLSFWACNKPSWLEIKMQEIMNRVEAANRPKRF